MQVGILHTNYRELTRRNAGFAGMALSGLNHVVNFLACSIHCHKATALSSDRVRSLVVSVQGCSAASSFLLACCGLIGQSYVLDIELKINV